MGVTALYGLVVSELVANEFHGHIDVERHAHWRVFFFATVFGAAVKMSQSLHSFSWSNFKFDLFYSFTPQYLVQQ